MNRRLWLFSMLKRSKSDNSRFYSSSFLFYMLWLGLGLGLGLFFGGLGLLLLKLIPEPSFLNFDHLRILNSHVSYDHE